MVEEPEEKPVVGEKMTAHSGKVARFHRWKPAFKPDKACKEKNPMTYHSDSSNILIDFVT